MTYDEYNLFCASLPATTHVVQWGGSHVWKVGGKVFCIGGWEDLAPQCRGPAFSFKVSEIGFEVLRQQAGFRPAPYLASRGLKWIQALPSPRVDQKELRELIALSHRLVAAGLSRKARRELGLAEDGFGRVARPLSPQ